MDAAFLRRHAREHDILHYAGHIDPAGWRMSESCFDRDGIERLSGGASLPSLVFANGCAGAEGPRFDESMLEAWLGGGVRHVLGPLFDLPDRLGRLFADAFYAALLSGETIGESVRLARLRLVDRVGAGSTPWGAYVLYGEPDLAYFEPDAEHASPDVTPTAPTRLRPVDAVPVAEVMRAAGNGTGGVAGGGSPGNRQAESDPVAGSSSRPYDDW